MNNPLHIVTTQDIKRAKEGGKETGMGLSLMGGIAAFGIVGGMSLFGTGDFLNVLWWTAGAAAGGRLLGFLSFRNEGDADKEEAEDQISAALAGIADDGAIPSKKQYDQLIMEGESIPFTVGGIGGASVYREKTFSAVDDGGKKTHRDIYSFSIDPLDDGTENFKRLLKQAVNTNADIRRAADK